MPVATAPSPSSIESLPSRVRFTREMFHDFIERQQPDDHRYELLEGDILEKMSQKQPHIGILLRWFRALIAVFGIDYVASQMPFVLSGISEPEPDIYVTTRSSDAYLMAEETPPAEDIRLLIEISVSTLGFDVADKAQLYAQGGISDYWIMDVTNRRLLVHRNPAPNGYASVTAFAEGESVSPLAAPNATFAVADFLP